MILHPSPGAPALVRAALTGVLVVHIAAGCVGLASGGAAMIARKGGAAHRRAGNVFVVSMLLMATIGGVVSPFLPQRPNVVPAIVVFYLVITGWATARRQARGLSGLEVGGVLLALGAAAIGVTFGLQAEASPTGLLDGEEPTSYFVLATVPAFAAMLDLTMLIRGALTGGGRLARHLWRMSLALFIAAASLFLGQPQVFPAPVRGSVLLFAPPLAVLAAMVFWLVRVRVSLARAGPQGVEGGADVRIAAAGASLPFMGRNGRRSRQGEEVRMVREYRGTTPPSAPRPASFSRPSP